jgi:hypothetical protein
MITGVTGGEQWRGGVHRCTAAERHRAPRRGEKGPHRRESHQEAFGADGEVEGGRRTANRRRPAAGKIGSSASTGGFRLTGLDGKDEGVAAELLGCTEKLWEARNGEAPRRPELGFRRRVHGERRRGRGRREE